MKVRDIGREKRHQSAVRYIREMDDKGNGALRIAQVLKRRNLWDRHGNRWSLAMIRAVLRGDR